MIDPTRISSFHVLDFKLVFILSVVQMTIVVTVFSVLVKGVYF